MAKGTGFVNFQDLFRLNQPGAQAMANTLTTGLDARGSALQSQFAAAEDAFNTASAAGLHLDPNVYEVDANGQRVIRDANGLSAENRRNIEQNNAENAANAKALERALADLYRVDDGSKAQWLELKDQVAAEEARLREFYAPKPMTPVSRSIFQTGTNEYVGPSGLENAQSLGIGFRQLNNDLGALQGQGGLEALMQRQYGASGPYSAGQSRFDAALSGVAAQPRVGELTGRYGQGLNLFNEAQARATNTAADRTKQALQAATTAQSQADKMQAREDARYDQQTGDYNQAMGEYKAKPRAATYNPGINPNQGVAGPRKPNQLGGYFTSLFR